MYGVKNMGKELGMMLAISLTVMVGYNMTLEREVLDTTQVKTVTVRTGDTLWSIAEQSASPSIDIRHMIYAVKNLNKLDNSDLKPGMKLHVPIVKKVNPARAQDYMAQN